MKKWNMIIDVSICENCNNCVLTAKDEYVGNEHKGYAAPQPVQGHKWIDIKRKVRGEGTMIDAVHVPVMCNHCDDAPCVKAGGGAVKKRDDGIVLIDPTLAKGKREIVDACPYGAVHWNEELRLPQHWPFDAHLLDQGWSYTRGTQSCPTGAMRSMKLEESEFAQRVARDKLEVLRPELGTKPRVWYKNLHRYTKCFVGGSVVARVGETVDCVAGADVVLVRDGVTVSKTTTDTFGEFKFDAITPNSGRCVAKISHPKLGRAETTFDVAADSVCAGDITLAK
jgi:Fe-S-cluster-containing dehydrogenase component